MRLFFWKDPQVSTNSSYVPYEEIDAKRTSKLGYFFLILMVILGIWQGNNLLDAIQNTIARPQANSYCLDELSTYAGEGIRRADVSYANPYDSYYYSNTRAAGCVFSAREQVLGIDALYEKISPFKTELATLQEENRGNSSKMNLLTVQRNTNNSNYQSSLLEKIADTEVTAFNQKKLQESIAQIDSEITILQASVSKNESRMTELRNKINSLVIQSKQSIQKAYDQYVHEILVYEFKCFVVSLIFIAPLFIVVWKYYHRLKRNRSEYTIIWGGAVAIVGFIFSEVILVFIYQILPKGILQKIFAFLDAFDFLWALLYWIGFVLVPVFFGFLIYLIQKKFYNKRAVMMRAIKSGHCPGCSFKFDHVMNHCPICGYVFKKKCNVCGSMTMDGGRFCETCGASQEKIQQ